MTSLQEFGLFSTAFAVQTTIFTLALLGVPAYVLREFPRRRFEQVQASLRLNAISSSLATVIAVVATVPLLASNGQAPVAVLLAISFLVEKNTEVRQAAHIAQANTTRLAFIQVVRPMVALLTLLVFGGVISPMIAYAAGRLMGSVASYAIAYPNSIPTATGAASLRGVLRETWPLASSSLLIALTSLDTAFVTLFASPEQAAFYGAAGKVTAPVAIAAWALAQSYMPTAAVMSVSDAKTARARILRFAVTVSLVSVPAALLGPIIMSLLFGAAYEAAGTVLSCLILATGAVLLCSVLQTHMQSQGLERTFTLASGVFAVISLAGAAVGAALLGALGAALSFTLTQWLFAIALMFLSRKSATGAPS